MAWVKYRLMYDAREERSRKYVIKIRDHPQLLQSGESVRADFVRLMSFKSTFV